jgi:hypothetical protein
MTGGFKLGADLPATNRSSTDRFCFCASLLKQLQVAFQIRVLAGP